MVSDHPAPTISGSLWRYRWSSLAVVVAVALVSGAVSLSVGHGHAAEARIVLKAPDQGGSLGIEMASESSFVRYVKQRALFVTSDRALHTAQGRIPGAPPVTELRRLVTAEASASGESIEIIVEAASLDRSTAIANAVIDSYREQSKREVSEATEKALRTLRTQREDIVDGLDGNDGDPLDAAASQTLSDLDQRTGQLLVFAGQFDDGVSFVDRAEPSGPGPVPGLLRDLAIGLILGTALAGVVAWIRADRDRRIRGAQDLAKVAGEPLLGEIATLSSAQATALRTPPTAPLPSYQLAASGLRTLIGTGVVAVTSTSSGEGATTTTLQLACAAARDGMRVLVVDFAPRSPELSRALGIADWPGLAAIAAGTTTLDKVTYPLSVGVDISLCAVPAGNPTRGARAQLRSQQIHHVIESMRSRFDMVLVDLPPITAAPETAPVIRAADGVVVTVRRDQNMDALATLRERIHLVGGTMTGYVLTFSGASSMDSENAPEPRPAALRR